MATAGAAIDRRARGGVATKVLLVIGGLVLVTVLGFVAIQIFGDPCTDRVQVAVVSGTKVELYTAFERDCGELGLAIVRQGEHRTVYYPLDFSTYRGLEDGSVTVYVSEGSKELWVQGSWQTWSGPVILGYYDVGRNVCILPSHVQPPCDRPLPDHFGHGGFSPIPGIVRGEGGKTVTVHVSEDGELEVEP